MRDMVNRLGTVTMSSDSLTGGGRDHTTRDVARVRRPRRLTSTPRCRATASMWQLAGRGAQRATCAWAADKTQAPTAALALALSF